MSDTALKVLRESSPVPGPSTGGSGRRKNKRNRVKKAKEDQTILQKLEQLGGQDLQSIPEGEFKFSNQSRLHLGHLSSDVTEDELKDLFKPYGEIAETFIDKDKCYAFLKVDFRKNAEKAQKELNGVEFKDKKIRVSFAPNATSVRVVNLDPRINDLLLYRTFEVFGTVERVQIILEEDGTSSCEGIVEFSRKNSALTAIRFCEQQPLFLTDSPRPVIVEEYEEEPEILTQKSDNPQFKKIQETLIRKMKDLKRKYLQDIAKLDEEAKREAEDQETEKLREQLKQKEEERDRQRHILEMKEQQVNEERREIEKFTRRTNEELQEKIQRQEEELSRRKEHNAQFMQTQDQGFTSQPGTSSGFNYQKNPQDNLPQFQQKRMDNRDKEWDNRYDIPYKRRRF